MSKRGVGRKTGVEEEDDGARIVREEADEQVTDSELHEDGNGDDIADSGNEAEIFGKALVASKKPSNKKNGKKRSRDSGSEVSVENVTKRRRKKSVPAHANSGSEDEEEIPPLNFAYVAKRWRKEAAQGIDKRIHDPVKAIEGSALWLNELPYELWKQIFSRQGRQDPKNLGKNKGDTCWTTAVLDYYFDGNRNGPFAADWFLNIYTGDKTKQADAIASLEQPIRRLFDNKREFPLAAALVIKLLEAKGDAEELPKLGSEILVAGIEYMKDNWSVWCQRLSLSEHLHGLFPDSVGGMDNKDDDYDTRYAAVTCYDKFLTERKRGSLGGSSRPSRPSTATSTALSTPLLIQPAAAKRNSDNLRNQLLDPACPAELNDNASDEDFHFHVPGWTEWTCSPEQQATWKKEGERMSADQLKVQTEELQRELAKAKQSRGQISASLRKKTDLVNKLSAQLEEYQILLDVKRSLQRKQEKLAETLGTHDSLDATDNLLGIFVDYCRSLDSKQFLQEIDSFFDKFKPEAASLRAVDVIASTSGASSKMSSQSVPPLLVSPEFELQPPQCTSKPDTGSSQSTTTSRGLETGDAPASKKRKRDQARTEEPSLVPNSTATGSSSKKHGSGTKLNVDKPSAAPTTPRGPSSTASSVSTGAKTVGVSRASASKNSQRTPMETQEENPPVVSKDGTKKGKRPSSASGGSTSSKSTARPLSKSKSQVQATLPSFDNMIKADAFFSNHKEIPSSQLPSLPQFFANKNKNPEQEEDIEKRRKEQLEKLGAGARRKPKTKEPNLSEDDDDISEDDMQKFKAAKDVYVGGDPKETKDPEADHARAEAEATSVNLGEEERELLKKTFADEPAVQNDANQPNDTSLEDTLSMPALVVDPKEMDALAKAISSISEENNGDEEP